MHRFPEPYIDILNEKEETWNFFLSFTSCVAQLLPYFLGGRSENKKAVFEIRLP